MDSAPEGLGPGGLKLWRAIVNKDSEINDEKNPYRAIAEQACRCKDACDELNEVCNAESVLADNGRGQPVTHPAWVEHRQRAIQLAQLIGALRLPDAGTAKRPQRRDGSRRGVYAPRSSKGFWGNGGDPGA